jgi:hypothetical protein
MTHTAQQRKFIHTRGDSRQMLGDHNTRQTRLNRIELTAIFGWCIGLGVERIDVRRPTVQIHKDRRRRFRTGIYIAGCQKLSISGQ